MQTLLADLARQDGKIMHLLESQTSEYRKTGFTCSLKKLYEMLNHCIEQVPNVYLVVDALDECRDRADLIKLLLSLKSSQANLRLFLTSRDEKDIREMLSSLRELSITSDDISGDIERYVCQTLADLVRNRRLKLRDSKLEELIRIKLCDKADGMSVSTRCIIRPTC